MFCFYRYRLVLFLLFLSYWSKELSITNLRATSLVYGLKLQQKKMYQEERGILWIYTVGIVWRSRLQHCSLPLRECRYKIYASVRINTLPKIYFKYTRARANVDTEREGDGGGRGPYAHTHIYPPHTHTHIHKHIITIVRSSLSSVISYKERQPTFNVRVVWD